VPATGDSEGGPYAGVTVTYADFEGPQNPVEEDDPEPTRARAVFLCHTWGAPGIELLVITGKDHATERMLTRWTVADRTGDPQLTCRVVAVTPYPIGLGPATQKDGPMLNTGDARVRNAVFSGGSMWLAFATSHQDGASVGAARWYQLDPVSGRPVQEGHFAVSDVHHCYPAIVPDIHGQRLPRCRAFQPHRASVSPGHGPARE
jgi:hypothetical protein